MNKVMNQPSNKSHRVGVRREMNMSVKITQILTQQALVALVGAGLILSTFSAQAVGGMQLGSTRVIYPQGGSEVSVAVSNTSDAARYLVQSWVADADGRKVPDFVVTPPLFVSREKSENTLRIMYVGGALPEDRESVFYLHNKNIPSVNPNEVQGKNVLQIAIESVIKVFVRPNGLPTAADKAPSSLRCSLSGDTLTLTNPSPYFVSLVNLTIGTNKQSNTMVPPKGTTTIKVSGGARGGINYQAVNDYGGNTPKMTCDAG